MRAFLKLIDKKPGIAAVSILSVLLGFSLAANFARYTQKSVVAADKAEVISSFRDVFVNISDKLSPSVVNITSEKTVEAPAMDDFFAPFGFGQRQKPQKQEQKATGTGVVVRSDGYIMTNDHVVGGADKVTVRLSDGREFKGKVLRDPRTDLALVKIEANNLPAVSFADSDKVKVGQWVTAIGNPFGLKNTVTVGVVSAIRRESDPNYPLPYPEVIQTDASINPGNSGGPLVDIDGNVVGINGAIFSRTGENVGIGFAIPSNTAKYVMSQLIEKGKVVRGYLGLEPVDLSVGMAKALGAKDGALVKSIDTDSAAEKGGIKVKDVIVKINETVIHNAVDLRHAVEVVKPESAIKVHVIRDKKPLTLTVTLGEAPSEIASDETATEQKVGLSIQKLTDDLRKQLGVSDKVNGVVVTSVVPGSNADQAGIEMKDVIAEINDTATPSVEAYNRALKSLKSGETAVVTVYRGPRSSIIELQID